MIDETTLSLQGQIEKPLIDCMRSLEISKLNTILLDSPGGNVEVAMSVGDMIAPYRPHLIIDKDCNSSCANYWLPLARRITFTKNARIVIHGSIDSGIINKMNEAEKEEHSNLKNLIELQARYIDRHNIPRGWMQYRSDYSMGLEAYHPWLEGKPIIPLLNEDIKLNSFLVTEPMLETCLPNIEIYGFKNSYAARASKKRWRKLAKKGQLSSGAMVCPAETVDR